MRWTVFVFGLLFDSEAPNSNEYSVVCQPKQIETKFRVISWIKCVIKSINVAPSSWPSHIEHYSYFRATMPMPSLSHAAMRSLSDTRGVVYARAQFISSSRCEFIEHRFHGLKAHKCIDSKCVKINVRQSTLFSRLIISAVSSMPNILSRTRAFFSSSPH